MGSETGGWWLGTMIALGALAFSGATLFNGARRATIELLTKQVDALRADVIELRRHCDRCDQQLAELRQDNERLMRQLWRRDESDRNDARRNRDE